MSALTKTDFNFPGQTAVYHGKVRDVYSVGDKLVMVASDRISAFDVVLPEGIPYKGQMLNQIAAKFLDATADICPNWKMATPDPMVTVGVRCEGFAVEMIVRGYLCGSAWRAYKSGVREICGVRLPEGMKENQKFPTPIITPTTKAEIGEHDADISKEEILAQGLATPEEYELLEKYTLALFQRGSEIAAERGELPLIVICDGVEDPHNLGAIIRSAECMGAHGIIIPKRRAVGLTPTVAKASAGAIMHMRIAKVTNLSQTIDELKERGIWFYAADMDGESIYDTDLKGSVGIVLGGEGDGVSRLVKEKCDFVISVPMYGKVNSMNVSCAAAVVLAQAAEQKRKGGVANG